MLKFSIILFFLLISVISVVGSVDMLTKYGKYCGKDHYDSFGGEAVDVFDRSCQIHDICCSSQGLLSCYCNEQLYWLISNLEPKTSDQSDIKDFILKTIYVSVMTCTNYYLFDEYYYVTRVHSNQYYRGFNYLPLRLHEPLKLCSINTDLFVYDLDEKEYTNFTATAYYNPDNIVYIKPDAIIPLGTCNFIYYSKNWKVIYNMHQTIDAQFQLIRKDRFTPLMLMLLSK